MMRTVWILAAKDLRLLLRDRMAVFFVLVVPVAYGLFFGILGRAFQEGEARLRVAVVDEDRSPGSQRFIQQLRSLHEDSQWDTSMDRSQALDACRRGEVAAVVVLPPGFGQRAGLFFGQPPEVMLAADPSRKAEQGMLRGMLMEAAGKLAQWRMQDPDSMKQMLDEALAQLEKEAELESLAEALRSFRQFYDKLPEEFRQQAGEHGPQFELIRIEPLELASDAEEDTAALLAQVRSVWDISFPQATIWGILGCATTFAASLVRERRQGSLVRLQLAPLRPGWIVAGKALACFLAVMAVILLMLLLGMALGMRPRRPLLLLPAMLATAFCFTGLMSCVATWGRSEEAVSGAAWGMNILMAMFGGGMIPLAFLPGWMQTVGHVDPVKWAVLVLEGAIWRDFSWAEAALPLAVLVGFGTAFLLLGTRILTRQLDR